MSESVSTVDLIRKVGIFGLCNTDGCLCINFSVHHISVDVSCRKSGCMEKVVPKFFGVEVRVYSGSLGISFRDLEPVANEVREQLSGEGYDIAVRFCDCRHDSEMLCVYCDQPRSDRLGYLCDKHKVDPEVAPKYSSNCQVIYRQPVESA